MFINNNICNSVIYIHKKILLNPDVFQSTYNIIMKNTLLHKPGTKRKDWRSEIKKKLI